MTDASEMLERLGLAGDHGGFYPLYERDGEQVWLTIVLKGARVKLCELSLARLMLLNKEGAEIAFVLGAR